MGLPSPYPPLPAATTQAAPALVLGVPMTFFPDVLQACIEAGTSWQREIARFADRRLAENLKSWQAVTAARNVMDLVQAQQDWRLTAAADYAEEARRMRQLATTLSLSGTTPAVQESARLLG